MLSFLAPGYLLAAVAAAAGLIAAHFIVRRQPRAMVLPTARFVPDAPVLTTGWAPVPADTGVLALRVLCVLLAGLALAQPFIQRGYAETARVILADRSRAIADSGEVSDSVAGIRAPGDVVIGYGATVLEERAVTSELLPGEATSGPAGRGSLSAGLVAAVRAASRFRDRADSVELVIVSSFAAEELDSATTRVRREWSGRARLVSVSGPPLSPGTRRPTIAAQPGDPLAVALAIASPAGHGDVRIVRGSLAATDSIWVSDEAGRVLVHWPAVGAPVGFVAEAQPVPVGGFITTASVVIALFQRRWQYVPVLGGRPVAWWIDGEVAAAELAVGRGCVRAVAIPVSGAGDFVLRPELHSALRELVQPCGGAPAFDRMGARALAMLEGNGGLAPSRVFAQPDRDGSALARWLLIAALACALLEMIARRRRSTEVSGDALENGSSTAARKVA